MVLRNMIQGEPELNLQKVVPENSKLDDLDGIWDEGRNMITWCKINNHPILISEVVH